MMKVKSNYLLSFFQVGFLFIIPTLESFFTLGDRNRYISFQSVNLSEQLSRTRLTDLIFNFGGRWLELFLGTLSIFLHFYLVNNFVNTLKLRYLAKIISFLWLLLPVHFILRSIAGKELLASLALCLLIILLYPYLFEDTVDDKSIPGYVFRKNKIFWISFVFAFFSLLLFLRPFFFIIFTLLFIPYIYRKIPLNKTLKKFTFISSFFAGLILFFWGGKNYYNDIQRYISLHFVGRGDSTYTVQFIPIFDSFSSYLSYLFQNISTSILGPLKIVMSTSVGPILLLEGLLVIIPIIFILFRNIFRLIHKPKFRLSKGLTDSSIMLLFLLLYALLGYVNFLAGWRFQSGSWILFILMYLKISKI